jgi:uncharacterized protein (DUF1800 family)
MKKLVFVALFAAAWLPHPAVSQIFSFETDRTAAHLLDQATWGPTPYEIIQVQIMGVNDWLNSQFSLNTSDLPDQPIMTPDGSRPNTDLTPVQSAFFQNAVTGQDQLRQRVAFALSEIWVVSAVQTNYAYAHPPYWRIFRDNAFGNYRDIIKAVTLSPAMGNYLNMANNNKGNAARGTAANENYARELMQLFTLGLTELNPDGTPALDASHQPVPTYDQAVVTNVARMLTGWTYPTAPGATARTNNPQYYLGQMFAVENNHDTTAKKIFGNISIPAGQTAEQDIESLLDALMSRDTMAPFVSTQLIQHLVTSNPTPAYIERVSKVFLNNGGGVRGDLKAVITAILTDPEARAGDSPSNVESASFGHLREPILFLTGLLRGLNAIMTDGNTLNRYPNQLGQNLFYPASVFSYFSPQYRTEKGLLGPEFQIHSTQTSAFRADQVNTALYGVLDKAVKLDFTPFLDFASDTNGLLDFIDYLFLHHSMSSNLRAAAMSAAGAVNTPLARVQAALYVVLTSSEYQVIQ